MSFKITMLFTLAKCVDLEIDRANKIGALIWDFQGSCKLRTMISLLFCIFFLTVYVVKQRRQVGQW